MNITALIDDGPARREVTVGEGDTALVWVDIARPDRSTLRDLMVEFGLPQSALLDFLDPMQLPKYERHESGTFIILRAHVEPTPPSAANARELTQEIAIFATSGRLLTLHHRDQRALTALRARLSAAASEHVEAAAVLAGVISATVETFGPPCDVLFQELGDVEDSLLSRQLTEGGLEQLYVRRRRASTLVTLLRRTREVIARLRAQLSPAEFGDVAELVDSLEFRAHELVEHADQLINLQIAVASHRTNEVVRLLTLISVVFMPLTFVVGLYGMNFDMPEFHVPHGYLIAYALIIGSVVTAVVWFRRRGWLG